MASHWILQREEYTDKIELPPDREEYTVGRGKENFIKCLSLYVSRRHCKFIQKHGKLTIVDQRSANGTYVNKNLILAEREIPLQEGDLIGIGVCEIQDQNCFVYKLLCNRQENEVNAITTLPDSSTADQELIILSDSDSQESREAQAIVLKRPAEQESVIKPKIRRLEGPRSESPFNSIINFRNRYLIKEENLESSSSEQVETMNVVIKMENDLGSERFDRERVETVILNLKPSENENKLESALENNLHTSNVNDKMHQVNVCKDSEKNHDLNRISNPSDVNSFQLAGSSHSSKSHVPEINKPTPSELVNTSGSFSKNESGQTAEIYTKGGVESNKLKQSLVENSDSRTENLIEEKNVSENSHVNLDDVLELVSKIETVLKTEPTLKMTLLEKLMVLKKNVASGCKTECLNESDHGEKEKNIACKSKNFVTTSEPQIAFKTESEDKVKSSTSKKHSVVPKNELKKDEEYITKKPENSIALETSVCCRSGKDDSAEPSTSKNSSVISKSEIQKKENSISVRTENSAGALEPFTDVSVTKKNNISSKDQEQNNSNKTNKTLNDAKSKNKKHGKKDKSNVPEKKDSSVSYNSAKKQKKDEKNVLSAESNPKKNKTTVIPINKASVQEEHSHSSDDLDLESDMRLQDVLYGKCNDFKSKMSSSEESGKILEKSNSSHNLKHQRHKSKKQGILSTPTESSSNESSVNSSRSSSIESHQLCSSENKSKITSADISSSNKKDSSDSLLSSSHEQCVENKSSNSNIENPAKVDSTLLATIKKNQLIVKLERLDDKINFPVNESQLNYTLDDDIIIISDDEDNMFPSSQVFDEKIIIKEEILDDPAFNKVIEDEDAAVFEEDELDADENEWLAKLSQDIIEPRTDLQSNSKHMTELPPQERLMDLDEKENDDAEDTSKGMTLKFPFSDDKSEKDEIIDDVFVKQSEKMDKPKSCGKSLIIDAPPMPPRKAKQRGISAEEAVRLFNERKEQSNQQTRRKSVVSDSIVSKGKQSKKKKSHSHSSTEDIFLTATEKKHIADIRKEKLKAISEKEKAAAAAAKTNSTKLPANVRIKVTNRNRGAFLIEGAGVSEENQNVPLVMEISKASIRDKQVPEPKKRELRSISAPIKSIRDLPRIPKIQNRLPSSESQNTATTSKCQMATEADVPEIAAIALPDLPVVKTVTSTVRKGKKTVRFKEGNDLTEVWMIPVAEDSLLLPVARKKDAPTPKKKTNSQMLKGPDLEEVIYDILCWNPKWLEEQKHRSPLEPPPVVGDKIWPMLSSFASYNDYLKVLTPLILLDLWSGVTKNSQLNPNDPRKAPVIVGIDHVDQKPSLTQSQKQLMNIGCHAVLSEFESQRNHHPRVGDLVYLELELENGLAQNHHQLVPQLSPNKRKIVPIFAYVKSLSKEMVTGTTKVHKEILPHTTRPTCKISFILQTRFRPYDVKTSNAMRIKVVSYIKSDLRLFQALAYLPSSPLCNHILQPEQQIFALPDVKSIKFAPTIIQDNLNDSQKLAILKTAQACIKPEPAICMIQGPPGTGKSHVIVNLIMQILYGQRSYRKHGSRRNSPRILLCAPSNAAVDELVLRLLHVRRKMTKEERFKMVRTGRQETINSQVKDISLVELAKRDVKNTTHSLEGVESVELEIRNLEALKNSKVMALESARKKNLPNVREIEFKLGEIERKLLQMKKSKFQNLSVSPRELARMERDAQERVLLGADIVATTLSSCFNNQMENIFIQNRESGFQFTCCIVDESTQSQELETLIPLMLGVNTLVLVGDAKQLPATVLSKVAKDHGLGKSLFARLQDCFEDTVKNPVQFLDTQYRMHPDICHWPNRFFYNSKLRTAPTVSRKSPLVPYCILSLDYEQDDKGELLNAGEAELVSQLTLGIIEKLGSKYSIGIITPYHMQRNTILSFVQSQCQGSQNVEVNTIDSFQGQERDIIVMSCVRTGGVGFLADTQRLNVALTRARYSLLLCGNFTSLRVWNDNMWRALLENAAQRKVLKYVPGDLAKRKDELLKLVLCD